MHVQQNHQKGPLTAWLKHNVYNLDIDKWWCTQEMHATSADTGMVSLVWAVFLSCR
jgi:hypothetical protein